MSPAKGSIFCHGKYTRTWHLQKLICCRNITTIQRKYWQKTNMLQKRYLLYRVAWDQAWQWGKKVKKRGQIGKTSASEASPVVAWVGETGAEPGDMPLMSLFHDTRLWYHALIGQMSSCWQIRGAVDSIALFQYHAPAIRKIFFKHRFRASNANVFARLFAYPSAPRRAKTYACNLLQNQKEAFKIKEFVWDKNLSFL